MTMVGSFVKTLLLLALCFVPGHTRLHDSTATRMLQDGQCNTVLADYTRQEVLQLILETGGPQAYAFAFQELLINGVQLRKICASCQEFSVSTFGVTEQYCDAYGSDVQYSGLAFFPLDGGKQLLPGTLKAAIFARATTTDSVPVNSVDEFAAWDVNRLFDIFTSLFSGQSSSSSFSILYGVFLAANGNIALAPSFMGYDVSTGQVHKGFLVKKAYQTSTIPLWYKLKDILANETDCASALADVVAGVGYGEGGYAIVAIAEALSALGVRVVRIHAGGAPFRVATAAILKLMENLAEQPFPAINQSVFLALFLSAYSSTYGDLANFDSKQDMLSDKVRDAVVAPVFQSLSDTVVADTIPIGDPLSVIDKNILKWLEKAIEDGTAPCDNQDEKDNGLLCVALMENDLTSALETTSFNITLCHSPQDRVVDIANLPLLDNPLLEFENITGSHALASTVCISSGVFLFATPEFQQVEVPDKHSEEGCVAALTCSPDGGSCSFHTDCCSSRCTVNDVLSSGSCLRGAATIQGGTEGRSRGGGGRGGAGSSRARPGIP